MISIYNKAIIKELNPSLLEQLEKLKEEDLKEVQIVSAKKEEDTLTYRMQGRKIYLHSRYQPSYEAEKLIDSCDDIMDGDNIIFFGLGLGYQIREVLKRYPNVKYLIVEPKIEIVYRFLERNELKEFGPGNLFNLCTDLKQMQSFIPDMFAKFPSNCKVVWLKNYSVYFEKEFSEFRTLLPQALRKERDVEIFYAIAQERLVVNEIENMQDILADKDLLDYDFSSLKGKTAILIAAGPSLDEEIENLKTIKEKGMAYIFPVGSAVNTLLAAGIHGDAVFSYDPSIKNQKVLQRIKDENITDIPMIYSPSIGFETLHQYPSPKIFVFDNTNYISNFFLEYKDREKIFLKAGPTISIMGLDALLNMGFDQIILVGQNLGIKGDKAYSSGISYQTSKIEVESQYTETEKDVYGNSIRTSTVYLHMKNGLERVIREAKGNTKIWNATKGGLHIEGTEFRSLEELMKEMPKNSVKKEWLQLRNNRLFDAEYMHSKIEMVELAKGEIEAQLTKLQNYTEELKKNGDLGIYKKLPTLYKKMNFNLKRVEENKYSLLFILPTMIQEYQRFVKKFEYFNAISDKEKQYQTIHREFDDFVKLYKKRMVCMEEKYKKLISVLEKYIEEQKES